MTHIKNDKLALILSKLDAPSLIGSYFPDWEPSMGSSVVMCPFHEDTNPSLNIESDGKAYCHGCGWKARDIIDLFAKLEGLGIKTAQDALMAKCIEFIPEAKIAAYVKCLRKNSKAMEYLDMERNLPLHIVKEFRLGYDPQSQRITIPIFDQFGYCRNVRRMGWLDSHRSKATNTKGMGEVRLYPEQKVVLERRLLLVEGEFDCLVGRAFGLPTCTWTGGASSWGKAHEHLFKGKAVWVCYDNDKAGDEGAELVEERLLAVGIQDAGDQCCLTMPVRKHWKDLTELSFICPEALSRAKDNIKAFKFPSKASKQHYCPHCGAETDRKGRVKK